AERYQPGAFAKIMGAVLLGADQRVAGSVDHVGAAQLDRRGGLAARNPAGVHDTRLAARRALAPDQTPCAITFFSPTGYSAETWNVPTNPLRLKRLCQVVPRPSPV